MVMLKAKFAKFAMGVMVVSVMSLGAVSPVNATEIQSDLDNNAKCTTQGEIQKDSSLRQHAAAQFTYNEDGDKILTVTPKSDFRSHHANFHHGALETPVVVDEETPVIDEVTPPAVETPVVVDEETPVVDEVTPAAVETPVVDEETPTEITKIGVYGQLVNAYDKLLNLYEKLLNSFELGTSI